MVGGAEKQQKPPIISSSATSIAREKEFLRHHHQNTRDPEFPDSIIRVVIELSSKKPSQEDRFLLQILGRTHCSPPKILTPLSFSSEDPPPPPPPPETMAVNVNGRV
jgi:hypothetical protein